jgi:hypothetical protein
LQGDLKKMSKTKKIIGLCAAAGFALGMASCGTPPAPVSSPATVQRSARDLAVELARPIRASQSQRPEWVDNVTKSDSALFFVGASLRFATESQARESAREDGRRQLVDYYGTLMVNKGREYSATYGLSNEVFSPQITGQRLNERIAQSIAQALGDNRFYWEYFMDENNREYYVAYVEMQIDKARVARVIDDFGKQEAADLQKKAAAEQDTRRRQQLEQAAEFFGGNLSSSLEL